jgi:hypothetical protein
MDGRTDIHNGFPHQDFIGHRPLREPMPKRRKKGREVGRKEEREKRRKEGRKEERKEGGREGRKEVRTRCKSVNGHRFPMPHLSRRGDKRASVPKGAKPSHLITYGCHSARPSIRTEGRNECPYVMR